VDDESIVKRLDRIVETLDRIAASVPSRPPLVRRGWLTAIEVVTFIAAVVAIAAYVAGSL
jgi:hypothetical protein